MWRYLIPAFFFAPPLPGVGRLPLNLLVTLGLFILGFAHPQMWLAGGVAEAAYLIALASNAQFQRLVDSRAKALPPEEPVTRAQLFNRLHFPARKRFDMQDQKCMKMRQAYRDTHMHDSLRTENESALDALLGAHLALLLNRERLEQADEHGHADELLRSIESAENDAKQPDISEVERQARAATLEILHKRLENAGSRARSLREIDSMLVRIEAQLDLALENASMPERQYSIVADVESAAALLEQSSDSDLQEVIAAVGRSSERVRG